MSGFFQARLLTMILATTGLSLAVRAEGAQPWVRQLDFGGTGWRGEIDIQPAAGPDGGPAVAWTIQSSRAESATFAFREQGIDLDDYDELVGDLYLEGSDAMPIFTLREWPRPRTLSNWYGKMRRPLEQWLEFRCDLRLDDDGVFLTSRYAAGESFPDGPELTFNLNPRFLRFKGEPSWRRLRVANLRLLRYPVRLAFDKRDAVYGETDRHYTTRYAVAVTSRLDQPGRAVVEAAAANLNYFQAAFDESGTASVELELAPGETRVVHLTFAIEKRIAEGLPPLFAESVGLAASMREVPGVVARPLMGYREWRLWAAVPAFHRHRPTPVETIAFYREIAKLYPEAASASANAIRAGEAALGGDHEVLTYGPGGSDQGYMCGSCQTPTLDAVAHDHHRCRTCGREYTDETMANNYYRVRHGRIIQAAADLASAYQHSGDERFARRVIDILLDYADKYERIVSFEPRSTSSQSKLTSTTLGEAFAVASHRGTIFDSYHLVAASPSLGDEERRMIEYDFLLNSGTRMMRHGAEMNQRAEYFTCFGLAGLYTGRWAMAGEAIYGDQGFLSLFDDGFSEDGIALEGGAYHHQTLMAMCRFARAFNRQGVNLYGERFKRVFDGSLARSPLGLYATGAAEYEAAYRMYRDPAYLPTLRQARQRPGDLTIREGAIGLPDGPAFLDTASNLEGTGYLYLRRNAPGGHRCLAINYGMQWEREENDRLHVQLYADGQPVSRQVGRITYGSPFSGTMYASFAHNLVTVDGQDLVEERVPLVGQVEEGALAAALFQVNDAEPLYPGVRQWKLVAIAGDHFVVIDRLESEAPRLYAWHYYPVADDQTVHLPLTAAAAPPGLRERPLPDGSLGPCRVGVLDGAPLAVDFAPANGLTLLAPQGAEVLDGRIMAGYRPRLTPFLRVATTAPVAEFAALHRIGGAPDAAIERIETPANVHAWRVSANGQTFLLGINATGQPVTLAGNIFAQPLVAMTDTSKTKEP